jgi:hypothetical protein
MAFDGKLIRLMALEADLCLALLEAEEAGAPPERIEELQTHLDMLESRLIKAEVEP